MTDAAVQVAAAMLAWLIQHDVCLPPVHVRAPDGTQMEAIVCPLAPELDANLGD